MYQNIAMELAQAHQYELRQVAEDHRLAHNAAAARRSDPKQRVKVRLITLAGTRHRFAQALARG